MKCGRRFGSGDIYMGVYAGLGPGETNRKAGSGWGRFRVQKQVVEGGGI